MATQQQAKLAQLDYHHMSNSRQLTQGDEDAMSNSSKRPIKAATLERRLTRQQDNAQKKPVPPSQIRKLDMLGIKKI